MTHGQSLAKLTSKLLFNLDNYFDEKKPDLVLAHGDTATCFSTALTSFYNSIDFYHVEAGLRSYCLNSPFPEEFNRQSIVSMVKHHFAPTDNEKNNLVKEGVKESAISVVGNTITDSLVYAESVIEKETRLSEFYKNDVLITLHRRENAKNLTTTLKILKDLILDYKNLKFLYPVHHNPSFRNQVKEVFNGLSNISLIEPLGYLNFIRALKQTKLIITDSGGIQEEAFYFRKPTFIVRNKTERSNGLGTGHVKLVGDCAEMLKTNFQSEINRVDSFEYKVNSLGVSPSKLIATYIERLCLI